MEQRASANEPTMGARCPRGVRETVALRELDAGVAAPLEHGPRRTARYPSGEKAPQGKRV